MKPPVTRSSTTSQACTKILAVAGFVLLPLLAACGTTSKPAPAPTATVTATVTQSLACPAVLAAVNRTARP